LLVFAEEDDVVGELVSNFEGFPEAKCTVAELDAEAVTSELAGQFQRRRIQGFAQRSKESIGKRKLRCAGRRTFSGFKSQNQAIEPMAKPMPGALGPPSISERPS
jgi:hypothetical protein